MTISDIVTFGFNVGIRDGKTTQRLARVRGSRVLRGGHAPQCLRSIRRRTISPGDDRLLLAACRLPLAACRLPLAASIEHRARRASAAHIASRAYATLR
ncbi:hypothetical protein [Burkholderia pseudomallei]|uniref:hypothetical protein n=1 Tax=Burkholderia pseudomallei TaxID=28450 RepID=UPI0021BBB646|nr:hypothetical protein [Burkholderia pseudomallei]MCT7919585.1 hypothetical protein [Burkholderia pseudomallei]